MTITTDIKRRFFDSLKRGTGEAYLTAQENPGIDFSNYIIKGALKNYAYDGQSEPSRAQYIFDLINISDKKTKIRKAILKGFKKEQYDTWGLTHWFDLVKLFAQEGDHEARQAIYDRFSSRPLDIPDWVGCQEILELDGLQGLFYIAEKFGKTIEQHPDNWQDDSIITDFQEDNPGIKVIKELENVARTNQHVRLYLDNVQRTVEHWKKQNSEPAQFKDIIEEVLNSKPFLNYRRTKALQETELKTIAEMLIVEKDSRKIEKLIEIFKSHKFPLDNTFILNLAKHKRFSKNRINEFAIDALRFLKSDDIREFALDRISNTSRPEIFVEIFVSNFRQGDSNILTEIVRNTNNEHKIESLAGSYVDIFKTNKTKECEEPLEMLYSKMNCGIHRNGLLEVLIENNVLSDRLNNEIKYDSYLETRALHKNN